MGAISKLSRSSTPVPISALNTNIKLNLFLNFGNLLYKYHAELDILTSQMLPGHAVSHTDLGHSAHKS